MTRRHADYFPRRANMYVPLLDYHSEVSGETNRARVELGQPIALVAAGILSLASLAVAATAFSTFATTYSDAAMAKYGRNVTAVASGAATSVITVRGYDYLGQPMSETLTLNGTTPVLGVKAFKTVASVTTGVAVAATTMNIGWGNTLGLPFCAIRVDSELVNNAAPTAGTFVAGNVQPQTATSVDPRGTYAVNAANLPDASREFVLIVEAKNGDLHGPRHFYA